LNQVGIKVILVRIARQLGKPRRISLADRAPNGVLIDIPNREVFEKPSEYGRMNSHDLLLI